MEIFERTVLLEPKAVSSLDFCAQAELRQQQGMVGGEQDAKAKG